MQHASSLHKMGPGTGSDPLACQKQTQYSTRNAGMQKCKEDIRLQAHVLAAFSYS